MQPAQDSKFDSQPDPDNPGWLNWNLADDSRFNGQAMGHLIARAEGTRGARLRLMPEKRHSNLHDKVHGGATLALIDIALFGGARIALGADIEGAVTLDLSTHFIGGGIIGQPLDAVTEVLKETRRLVFLRGVVEQGDHLVASFSGTLRKASRA